LLWVTDFSKTETTAKNLVSRNSSAPTWSWASTTTPIDFHLYGDACGTYRDSKAAILDINLEHQTEGAWYGSTISGHLFIRGFVTPVDWIMPTENIRGEDGDPPMGWAETMKLSPAEDLFVDAFPDSMETDGLVCDGRQVRVALLVVATTKDERGAIGLILRKCSQRLYSRLGCFRTPPLWGGLVIGSSEPTARSLLTGDPQEITIV
jgi:hypothetical protein